MSITDPNRPATNRADNPDRMHSDLLGPSRPSRQRRIAWFAAAWLHLITRLGAHFDWSEPEDALPFDPLLSER